MCKYCKINNPALLLDEAGWEAQLNWEKDGYAYITFSIKGEGFASITANYCPVCGRYLYEGNKSKKK